MAKLVFIVGTGRCGTESVAKVLGSVPGNYVVHEMRPKLLREALEYRSGRLPHDELVALLRSTRGALLTMAVRIAGEANNRLSFVLPALAEAFPDAKYIHLVRDGRDVVASYYQRRKLTEGNPDAWDRARIEGDKVGEFSSRDWARVDLFGSTCWFWSYTNRLISEDAQRLGLEMISCRIEEIDKSLGRIFGFLGLDDVESPAFLIRKNITRGRPPLRWCYWSRRQRRTFEKFAGEEMDKWYPGWSSQMQFSVAREGLAFSYRVLYHFLGTVGRCTRVFRQQHKT